MVRKFHEVFTCLFEILLLEAIVSKLDRVHILREKSPHRHYLLRPFHIIMTRCSLNF